MVTMSLYINRQCGLAGAQAECKNTEQMAEAVKYFAEVDAEELQEESAGL